MNFMWKQRGVDTSSEDMARAASKAIDEALVEDYASRLDAAATDHAQFDAIYKAVEADKALKSPELIAIARAYAGAARKLTSKKAALDAIRKRFVERVRFEAKNELAAKSRPW
jgi:hypothetical protein